jgi:hypothetical protein
MIDRLSCANLEHEKEHEHVFELDLEHEDEHEHG